MSKCFIVMCVDYDGAQIDKVYTNKKAAEERSELLTEKFTNREKHNLDLDKMDCLAEPFDADWSYFGSHFSIQERELINKIGGVNNE